MHRMTRHDRSVNTLMVMREACGDPLQRQALDDAILLMREASRYFDRAWLQGFKDGKVKGACE